jgi:7-cyano-7-deazaguanine synthase
VPEFTRNPRFTSTRWVPIFSFAMKKAICLLSGGLDSTVATAWARQDHQVHALHVQYGQRAEERERLAAEAIARQLGAFDFRSTKISWLRELGHSALTDPAIGIPHDAISTGPEIPITQVPFRNGILLSLGCAWAEAIAAEAVVIGAVEEDSSGYPDCREGFLTAFEQAVVEGVRPERHIRILAPLVHKTKAQIVRLGAELAAPFHLSWSCYDAGPEPCGSCESCLLRARGFEAAGIADPLSH